MFSFIDSAQIVGGNSTLIVAIFLWILTTESWIWLVMENPLSEKLISTRLNFKPFTCKLCRALWVSGGLLLAAFWWPVWWFVASFLVVGVRYALVWNAFLSSRSSAEPRVYHLLVQHLDGVPTTIE